MKKIILLLIICTPLLCFSQETAETKDSPMSGMYEGDRKIWVTEKGNLSYQRTGAPLAMKLVFIEENIYELSVPAGVRTPGGIPNVRFILSDHNEITGIELVHEDGKIDGPFKKITH